MTAKLSVSIRRGAHGIMLLGMILSILGMTGPAAASTKDAITVTGAKTGMVVQSVQNVSAPPCPSSAYGVNQDDSFFTGVLGMMGVPVSQFALNAFSRWRYPSESTNACWNPLATKYPVSYMAGTGCTETFYNNAGVRNYSSNYCGELATAKTLLYTRACGYDCYKPIRDMLAQITFNWQAIDKALII